MLNLFSFFSLNSNPNTIFLFGKSFSKLLKMKTRVFVILALKNVSLSVD